MIELRFVFMQEGDILDTLINQGGPTKEFWVLFMGKLSDSHTLTQEEKGHLWLLPSWAGNVPPECGGFSWA